MGTPKKPKPTPMKKRPNISTLEAADILGVHRNTVINLLRDKTLDGFKRGFGLTSHWRVYVDSLEDFRRKRGEH